MHIQSKRALLAATVAAGAAVMLMGGCTRGPAQSEGAATAVSGIALETIHASPIPETYEAVGTIESRTTSNVGAQVGGTVRQVAVKPGDRVRAGEVLAVLDGRAMEAEWKAAQAGAEASAEGLSEVERQIEAAAAQRKFAEATYERYKALLAKASVSRQEFDNAETQYRAAAASEAALEARRAQMEAGARAAKARETAAATEFGFTRIVAPLNGIVTAKLVDPGTLVMPGAPLFTVEDPEHYRLAASLAAKLLPKVRMGEEVEVSTSAGRMEGRVAEIVPAAEPASRTFVAKIELPLDCGCRSGEYATADFAIGETKGLSLPETAVVERGQLEGIFVVDGEGRATYRLIKTGKSFDHRVEVLSGLSPGEQVAVSGTNRLRDGVKVEAQ